MKNISRMAKLIREKVFKIRGYPIKEVAWMKKDGVKVTVLILSIPYLIKENFLQGLTDNLHYSDTDDESLY